MFVFGYEIGDTVVHNYNIKTITAIDQVLDNIKFPFDDPDELKKLEREFRHWKLATSPERLTLS
jgi:hypothetical protein